MKRIAISVGFALSLLLSFTACIGGVHGSGVRKSEGAGEEFSRRPTHLRRAVDLTIQTAHQTAQPTARAYLFMVHPRQALAQVSEETAFVARIEPGRLRAARGRVNDPVSRPQSWYHQHV